MAKKEPLPMHPDFARWHASVGLGDDESRRQSRWVGVSAVAQAADSKDIEALIRLAFKSRQPAADAQVQKTREVFRSADATFEMQGNDRELQVLAAASLAALMNEGGSRGGEAALAITTTSLAGARKTDLPMELQVLAENAIDKITEANHKRPDLSAHTSSDAPKFDFEKSATQVRNTQNWESVAQAFTMAAAAVSATFAQIARRQTGAVHAMDNFLRVQDEELQMLWWLTGQRSFDLDCTFDKVPANAQLLIFGKELADCTACLPGPASVKALLSRAGLNERKKIALSEAINEADAAWLETIVTNCEPSPVTTPIHYGIKRQLETGAGGAWIPGWAAAVGVARNFSALPLLLGNLFYRERLLLLFGDK